MGITVIEIDVANVSDPDRTELVEFLVDSGATYSVVHVEVLDRLGIRPLTEQSFRLANGEKITRRKDGAIFKYGERIGAADVV
jgi:predicted aspartyl protease